MTVILQMETEGGTLDRRQRIGIRSRRKTKVNGDESYRSPLLYSSSAHYRTLDVDVSVPQTGRCPPDRYRVPSNNICCCTERAAVPDPLWSQVAPSSARCEVAGFAAVHRFALACDAVRAFAIFLSTLQTPLQYYPPLSHRSALAALRLKPPFIHLERWHRTALYYAVAPLIKTSTATERQLQASDFASAAQSAHLQCSELAQTHLPPEWMTSRRPSAL